MKKRGVIILFFLVSILTYGQKDKIRYGIKGGINFSTITGREIFDKNNPRIGAHIGLLLEIPLNDKFLLQPELLYSQQGSRFVQEIEFRSGPLDPPMLFDIDFDFNLNYITLPVLFKYKASERFSFGLGPQIAYLVNAKEKNNFSEQLMGGSETESDIKDGFTDFDLSVRAGISYCLESGLFFELSYGLSVIKINKFENPIEPKSQRNSVFQLSTGYKF